MSIGEHERKMLTTDDGSHLLLACDVVTMTAVKYREGNAKFISAEETSASVVCTPKDHVVVEHTSSHAHAHTVGSLHDAVRASRSPGRVDPNHLQTEANSPRDRWWLRSPSSAVVYYWAARRPDKVQITDHAPGSRYKVVSRGVKETLSVCHCSGSG